MQVKSGGFCCNCFNHLTDRRVVEFDAAWEGGVVDGLSVDDLFLCESCVSAAAEVLAVEPQQVERLEARVKFAEGVAEKWQKYAEDLERSLSVRPEDVLKPVAKTGRKVSA